MFFWFLPSGRNLIWEISNSVKFINICSYFMVVELFLSFHFRTSITRNFALANRWRFVRYYLIKIFWLSMILFLLVQMSLKKFLFFEDSVTAARLGIFQCSVEHRFSELDGN